MPERSTHAGSSYEPGKERSLQALRLRLGTLIHRYVDRRSNSAAQAVLETIDILRQHPDNHWDMADHCACLRLRAHWQMLAQTSHKA